MLNKIPERNARLMNADDAQSFAFGSVFVLKAIRSGRIEQGERTMWADDLFPFVLVAGARAASKECASNLATARLATVARGLMESGKLPATSICERGLQIGSKSKLIPMYPIPDCRKCLQPLIRDGSKIMEVESIDTTAPTDKNAGLKTARRVGCVNLYGRTEVGQEVGREIHKASHPLYRKGYP